MLPFYHIQKMLIMGIRDFRDRLNNQKIPMNEGAWSQMESLLDSIPPSEEPRKKRGFIWIFLLFGLLVCAGILSQYDLLILEGDYSAVGADQIISDVSTGKINVVEGAILKVETGTQNDKYSSLVNVGDHKQSQQGNEDVGYSIALAPSVRSDKRTGDMSTDKEKVTEAVITISQRIESVSDQVKSANQSKSLYSMGVSMGSLKFSKSKQSLASSTNKKVGGDSIGFEIPEKGDLSISGREQLLDKTVIEESKRRLNWMTDRLSTSSIKSILGDSSVPISMEDIDIKMLETKDLYITVQSGPAMFNNNPGYIVGFGIFKDINKLIAASIDVNYAYGSHQNIPMGEPFTFERQLDFGASIHVNLIRTVKSKISIELGLGYALYGGERVISSVDPINIDVRSSRGLSYNVGLSYNYFITKTSFVGIKLGAIAYDDAIEFGMLKFGKAF